MTITHDALDLTKQGPPDMFKLGPHCTRTTLGQLYEAHTVGKRMVGILQGCFLVKSDDRAKSSDVNLILICDRLLKRRE